MSNYQDHAGEKLDDEDYVTPNYKSKMVQLLFDPVAQYQARNQVQAQLYFQNDDEGSVLYKKRLYDRQYKESTDKFLQSYVDYPGRLQIFSNVLRQRINTSRSTVKQYNLQEIADFFPWVMSCQMLFDPIRTTIYCLSQNISPQNQKAVSEKLSPQMINQVVNRAIFQCVKYNAPYIQLAKQIYRQKPTGFIARLWVVGQQIHAGFVEAGKVLAAAGNGLYNTVKKGVNAVVGVTTSLKKLFTGNARTQIRQFDISQEKAKDAKYMENHAAEIAYRKTILLLLQQIFGGLRCYGDIILNYNYLKKGGWVKMMEGQSFYYFPDQPTLLFSFKNSFPTVYFLNNGKLQPIPQAQFTKKFLIGLITADVLKLGGRMLKNAQDQYTQTQKQRDPMTKFSNKYLNWAQDRKVLTAKQYGTIYNSLGNTGNLPVRKANNKQKDLDDLNIELKEENKQ